jgi:hypothetical protein
MIRGFSAVLIATDGVGPPPQKKDPRRRARAKSQGSPTTRALSFGNPAPAPAQVRREARILHEQGIAEVPLTRGKVAIIDIDDAERVSAYQWRGIVSDGIWYAATQPPRSGGTRATILLHRFLLDSPAHAEVDHIDGDGLNCRRSNLRLATRVQNSRNSKRPSDNTSGFKGVSRSKGRRKWRVRIGINGTHKHLGCFRTKEEAAQAYDQAALRLFGQFARVNGAQANGEAAAA